MTRPFTLRHRQSTRRSLQTCLAGSLLAALLFTTADGQGTRPPARKVTSLSFEVIAPNTTSARVVAQDWGRVFQKLGHTLRIRTQTSADGTGPAEAITQTETRGTRRIRAVGLLDRTGRIHFGRQTFTLTDIERLRKWIDDLKTWGKDGNPVGKPMWGLTSEAFGRVFDALAKPANVETRDRPLEETIRDLSPSAEFPMEWTEPAKRIAAEAAPGARNLTSFSRGTAMAILLNDAGLGFFPRRQPNGSLQLVISKPAEGEPFWPIGWDPSQSLARTIPGFYKPVDVELPNVSLSRVFAAISERTGVPVLVDTFHLRASGLDFESMKVEIPAKKLSWNRVVQAAATRNRLASDTRIDELGKPFVWITTPQIQRARSERFRGGK